MSLSFSMTLSDRTIFNEYIKSSKKSVYLEISKSNKNESKENQ